MRIIVTGASGLLGSALTQTILEQRPDWELTGVSRQQPRNLSPKQWLSLDLTQTDAARREIVKINPDAIIHCAALSQPDVCEKKPDEAWTANYIATRNIALACDRFDTELIHLSTDQVFYGLNPDQAHDEYATPQAGNVYGETKIAAERFIRDHLRRYCIVRTGKIFGGPNDTKSFFHFAWTKFSTGESIKCAVDWAAHATHAFHLSGALIVLLEKKTYGIYHLASPEVPNYLELAQKIATAIGAPKNLAIGSSRKEIALSAGRPARCELSLKHWLLDFKKPLPSWQEGITLFAQERQKTRSQPPTLRVR